MKYLTVSQQRRKTQRKKAKAKKKVETMDTHYWQTLHPPAPLQKVTTPKHQHSAYKPK